MPHVQNPAPAARQALPGPHQGRQHAGVRAAPGLPPCLLPPPVLTACRLLLQVCGRCVRKLDHHCPAVLNCVGAGNQRVFACFTLCMATSQVSMRTLVLTAAVCPHPRSAHKRAIAAWPACCAPPDAPPGAPQPAQACFILSSLSFLVQLLNQEAPASGTLPARSFWATLGSALAHAAAQHRGLLLQVMVQVGRARAVHAWPAQRQPRACGDEPCAAPSCLHCTSCGRG